MIMRRELTDDEIINHWPDPAEAPAQRSDDLDHESDIENRYAEAQNKVTDRQWVEAGAPAQPVQEERMRAEFEEEYRREQRLLNNDEPYLTRDKNGNYLGASASMEWRDWKKAWVKGEQFGRLAQREEDAYLHELEEAHIEMHRYNNSVGQTVCEFCEAIERAAAIRENHG